MAEKPALIVAIGASAGGINALQAFFHGIPGATGMAFVVVTHLSPDRESHLQEVMSRFTSLPVRVAEDKMTLVGDTVYVMPPGYTMIAKAGRLQLTPAMGPHRDRHPIDLFFVSLAEDQKDNAAAIVMSGGDSDGSFGIKAINQMGGITLAQTADGGGPQNPEMPRNAIATGLIDFALPAEDLAVKLVALVRERAGGGLGKGDILDERAFRRLHETICDILQKRTGHDFRGYKTQTFRRRLLRRMIVTQAVTIDDYVTHLSEAAHEAEALFRDLLINVTDFFRDADAFSALETLVIPRLFDDLGAEGTIRVWVPGCATGEEAYSIAILLREQMERTRASPRIQMFATDIDDAALRVARAGRFAPQAVRAVGEARLARFFRKDGDAWVVAKDVRDICVFSPHSLTADPPFSRIDLISCRNLMIYLGPELQRQIIPTFHYAIRPGGYLMLGTSESLAQHPDLFSPLAKGQRLYQKRDGRGVALRLPRALSGLRTSGATTVTEPSPTPRMQAAWRQALEAQILERHAPPHVVVTGQGEIVYYSARTGRYLEQPRGGPDRQIYTSVRSDLRSDLRSAMREVAETRQSAKRHVALTDAKGGSQAMMLQIDPIVLGTTPEPLYIVLFLQDAEDGQVLDLRSRRDPADQETERLERALQAVTDKLQATVEDYETALEELKSSNEEMLSVNEEVQSTNEELEASKEELQSLNEELNTINTELAAKVDEVDRANSDLRNLYESTQIASVFLDAALVVRHFTPAAHQIFALRPGDIGRPLTELASVRDYPDLAGHIRRVAETGEMIEQRLGQTDGTEYLARLIPYTMPGGRTDGVVITFFDVTHLVDAQHHKELLIAELNHRVKNMLAVAISVVRNTLNPETGDSSTQTLLGRLHAMARVYRLLSEHEWTDVDFRELIGQELAMQPPERVTLDGSTVRLKPEMALALAMVLHETATNAVLHGALSTDGGSLTVTWTVTADTLHLDWQEIGGPVRETREPEGFGFVLTRGQIEHRLKGTMDIQFGPGEFHMTASIPLSV